MVQIASYRRFEFVGSMYLPLEDPTSQTNTPLSTYIKDVRFDFAADPSAPRSVMVSDEPFPQSARILFVKDKFDKELLEGAIFTVTGAEAVLDNFGQRIFYRHQVALAEALNFGYENIQRG